MKKLLTAALLLTATTANADLYGGGHYTQLESDGIKLGGIGANLGYEHSINMKTAVIAEAKFGLGVQDETEYGVNLELDDYRIFSVKAKYITDTGVYFTGSLSHATINLTASYRGYEYSDSGSEAGYGAGIGYDFETLQTDVELTYEKFDDVNVATINFKFDF